MIDQTYRRAEAFLFGRRTYELFAGYLGGEERARAATEDPGSHPIAAALNTKPKYLASTTLADPRWANTTVLSGDLVEAIGKLKATPAGELQVHGSGALSRWLLANDLVDEMTLRVVPVILGQGARLFPDTGPDIALDLVESRADSKGVMIQVYRPTGRPRNRRDTVRRPLPDDAQTRTLPDSVRERGRGSQPARRGVSRGPCPRTRPPPIGASPRFAA